MTIAVSKKTKEKAFSAVSVLTITFFVSHHFLQDIKSTSLIRPLLAMNRYDTKKLCQFWGMPVYPDLTNEELVFSRNRVRKQLLPMLRSFFNPQIDIALSYLSETLLIERLYTESVYSNLCQLENSLVSCRPLPVKEEVVTRHFVRTYQKWKIYNLSSKMEKKPLSAVLLKQLPFQAPGSKVVIQCSEAHSLRDRVVSHMGDVQLRCVTTFNVSNRNSHDKKCLFLKHKKNRFCQSTIKTDANYSFREQLFYFPKIGGLIL